MCARYQCRQQIFYEEIQYKSEQVVCPNNERLVQKGEEKWNNSDNELTVLPTKKRGRLLLLGENFDHQIQMYLRKIREQGGKITAAVVVAAARGIIMVTDKNRLVEFGGYVNPNKH